MKIKHAIKLTPRQRLLYWIRERECIRLKKEAGEPKPWTDDEILQSYRFCNVRRMDDKVSRWLYNNWYYPNLDHPNMLLACTLARQLNNPDSLAAIGFPTRWNPSKVEGILLQRAEEGLKNYSAAYMITGRFGFGSSGRLRQTKPYQTVYTVCHPVYTAHIEIDSSSMQNTWSRLLSLPGFSPFIAGQVTADLRWGVSGSWEDKKVWAPIGPGSRRGMNILLTREINYPLKQAKFERELVDMMSVCCDNLSPSIINRLEAIDYQNCLCEYSKYSKALHGMGNPKRLYSGVQ